MGDSFAGQSQQIPLSVRIPVSSIRAHTRPIGSIASPNFQRPSMVNQVYLLPKSGIGGTVHPNQPSVMQVRSLATGQTMIQSNGVVNSSVATKVGSQSSAKIVGFFNQLMELSKNVSVQTHNSVVVLIQALVNGELDASSFCTQLRTNLKSANTNMDLVPFVKDNIESLRRDLSNGLYRLPNIQTPPKDVIMCVGSTVSTVSILNTVTLQGRPSVTISTPILNSSIANSPRIALPGGLAPRIVGTLMTSSTTAPMSSLTSVTHRSQPLLAPAPPRLSASISPSLNSSPVSKYRIAQPIGNLIAPSIFPNSVSGTVVASRLTQPRQNIPNLRPIASNLTTSSNLGMKPAAATCFTNANITPLLRAKPTYTGMGSASNSTGLSSSTGIKTLVSVGAQPSTDSQKSDYSDATGRLSLMTDSGTKDNPFFPPDKIRLILAQLNMTNFSPDATICLSHGLQVFVKSFLAKLYIQVSHRLDRLGDDGRLVQMDHNAREQLRFLQKLDEHNRLRQSELEKDIILRAAKSRSRNEDPHHLQMREMARRIATEDYEREKQHQANLTALHAIGPQRKRRIDMSDPNSSSTSTATATTTADSALHLAQTDHLSIPYSLSTGGDVPTHGLSITSPLPSNRLSVISANRLGSLFTTSNPQRGLDLAQSYSSHSNTGSTNLTMADQHQVASSVSSSFSLTHSLKVHRATLRDIQLIMGRNPRLRRTRTFYRTHWRSSN